MAELLRQALDSTIAARLEHEKLEALKELAYGASHEINNPLANIAARAQSLLADERDPERRRKLVAIHRQALRAHEMIADLMLFARPPMLSLGPCDLHRLVRQVVEEQRERAAERNIDLSAGCGEGPIPPVAADFTQLGVALAALVTNSIEAVGANGRVRVVLRHAELDDRAFVEISVRDDGPGVSPSVREHLFDPFFSGREAGRGLGFGLSKCWRIVTDHGGQIAVRDVEHGAEIALLLPARIAADAA
jgi:signal transduction histidine kinase